MDRLTNSSIISKTIEKYPNKNWKIRLLNDHLLDPKFDIESKEYLINYYKLEDGKEEITKLKNAKFQVNTISINLNSISNCFLELELSDSIRYSLEKFIILFHFNEVDNQELFEDYIPKIGKVLHQLNKS